MLFFSSEVKHIFNRDLLYTGINQFWRLISGPLVLVCIPLFLTSETQGFWYAFTSISALAVFADLGFTTIVTQFVAHEFAFLHFEEGYRVNGDEYYLKRLASFFTFTIKWVFLMVVCVFPIILAIGFFIFYGKHAHIDWVFPWIIFVSGSAINFFNAAILSFIEGCNLIGIAQKIRFEVAVVNTVIIISSLYFHLNLYGLALGMLISSSLISFYLIKIFKRFIKQLFEISQKNHYSWCNEFFRLLWRYAISFSSGYFIFQIYTPLAFVYHGPVEAGKVGISIQLWTAIFTSSLLWMYLVTPKLNMLVSTASWKVMDATLKKNLLLSVLTFLFGCCCVIGFIFVFKGKIKLLDRFLDLQAMLCLAIAWFIQLIITSLAVYLRAHKAEPLLLPSVVNGVYIALTTFLCAKFLSTRYLFLGFTSSYLWYLPWVLYIFNTKKRLWHK